MKSTHHVFETGAAPRRRGRPRDLDKLEAIVAAAGALFSERGIAPTTMEAVAERAGVSKMTVYSHFRDKSALLRSVFERNSTWTRFGDLGVCRDARTAIESLINYGETFVLFVTRPEIIAAARSMAESAREFPDLAAAFYEAGPAANRARVARFLRGCVERRYFVIPQPEAAAEILLAAWLGTWRERQIYLGTAPPSPREVADSVRFATETLARAWAAAPLDSAPPAT